MIIFHGRYSEKCITATAKQQNKSYALACFIFTLLAIIVTILIAIFDFTNFYYFLSLTIILIFVNILLLLVPHNSIVFRLSRKITFDFDQDLVIIEIEDFSEKVKPKTKKISTIKSIEDQGEWYYINFKIDFTENIVCQKNLIEQGTIEEFEEIFKDKIIKKTK